MQLRLCCFLSNRATFSNYIIETFLTADHLSFIPYIKSNAVSFLYLINNYEFTWYPKKMLNLAQAYDYLMKFLIFLIVVNL
jgi:hypothetical protein